MMKTLIFGLLLISATLHAESNRGRDASNCGRHLDCPDCRPKMVYLPSVFKTKLAKDIPELEQLYRERSENPTWTEWQSAVGHLAEIEAFVAGAPGGKKRYFGRILEATRAALTKHQLEYARERYLARTRLSLHLEILRTIAAFKSTKGEYSLYQIKRAIEKVFAMKEYVGCR